MSNGSYKETLESKRIPEQHKPPWEAKHPEDIVSVDQVESSIPGFIGQETWKLIR
jgi:hypothetical protein